MNEVVTPILQVSSSPPVWVKLEQLSAWGHPYGRVADEAVQAAKKDGPGPWCVVATPAATLALVGAAKRHGLSLRAWVDPDAHREAYALMDAYRGDGCVLETGPAPARFGAEAPVLVAPGQVDRIAPLFAATLGAEIVRQRAACCPDVRTVVVPSFTGALQAGLERAAAGAFRCVAVPADGMVSAAAGWSRRAEVARKYGVLLGHPAAVALEWALTAQAEPALVLGVDPGDRYFFGAPREAA